MFKKFFGSVWSGIKAAPKKAVSAVKYVGTMAVGVVSYAIWFPIAAVKVTASMLHYFGEDLLSKIGGLFSKMKGFKVSSAETAAEAA